jgi:enamine deaminase RidA (YjgF/YER057c/UK114 family)
MTRAQVFVKSMDDYGAVNGLYAEFFGDHKPARSLVEAARLPRDVLFEIECIARSVLLSFHRRYMAHLTETFVTSLKD